MICSFSGPYQVLLIKYLEAKISHFFVISDILTALATHQDAYMHVHSGLFKYYLVYLG